VFKRRNIGQSRLGKLTCFRAGQGQVEGTVMSANAQVTKMSSLSWSPLIEPLLAYRVLKIGTRYIRYGRKKFVQLNFGAAEVLSD